MKDHWTSLRKRAGSKLHFWKVTQQWEGQTGGGGHWIETGARRSTKGRLSISQEEMRGLS